MNLTKMTLVTGAASGIFIGSAFTPVNAAALTGTITVNATSSGSAVAGTDPDTGMPTTPEDVMAADANAQRYNGPTTFTADYTVTLNPDNTLNTAASTVTFTTINYTADGMLEEDTTQYLPVNITSVVLTNDVPPWLVSFTFNGNDWYPPTAIGADDITNNGLSGFINLKTGKSSYTASYIDNSNGAVYTYVVTSVPETNATLSLLAFGTLGIASILKRKLKPSKSSEKDLEKVYFKGLSESLS